MKLPTAVLEIHADDIGNVITFDEHTNTVVLHVATINDPEILGCINRLNRFCIHNLVTDNEVVAIHKASIGWKLYDSRTYQRVSDLRFDGLNGTTKWDPPLSLLDKLLAVTSSSYIKKY